MLEDGLHDLAVWLATSYALVGLIAAFAVVALLNAFGLLRIPQRARRGFFGAFAVLIAGFVAAYGFGLLKSPQRAAQEIAAAAESEAVAAARARNVAPSDGPASTGALPTGTVYIQAPDMDARFAADGLSKALRAAGFRSPGIELVSSGSPSRPEVRYFNDADRPIADRVASIAARHGLPGAVVRSVATYKAPPGQIEFWYPAE